MFLQRKSLPKVLATIEESSVKTYRFQLINFQLGALVVLSSSPNETSELFVEKCLRATVWRWEWSFAWECISGLPSMCRFQVKSLQLIENWFPHPFWPSQAMPVFTWWHRRYSGQPPSAALLLQIETLNILITFFSAILAMANSFFCDFLFTRGSSSARPTNRSFSSCWDQSPIRVMIRVMIRPFGGRMWILIIISNLHPFEATLRIPFGKGSLPH